MSETATPNSTMAPALGTVSAAAAGNARPSTYGQIIKSSALIGGSSVFKIALGIVRTKAMAVFLGPAGVGLMGVYSSILDMASMLAGMGINSSGVREIAEAAGTGDTKRIARTVTTLRRVALVLGLLGALLLLLLSRPVARLSFGDVQAASGVALLGLAVFLGAVSGGQLALIQGMRQIGNLARANVLGGLLGTVLSIGIIYVYRQQGIVASLVGVAAMGIAASWWYSRQIEVEPVAMRAKEVTAQVSALLKLGFVFMACGLMSVAVAYFVRILVMRQLGADAAGYYQSAWTLGGLYVGFILQAMAADFFPRLTAVANDNAECNRLVNEQAEVGLLIAGPGILGTLTFAPLVIQLFYSAKFGPAVEILRWVCLGMMLRVASWPMGFVLGAKGLRQAMLWSETAAYASQLGFTWICLAAFGLSGTGIAFFASYVFYWLLIYGIVRSVSGFRWSVANEKVGLLNAVLMAVVFGAWYIPVSGVAVTIGTVATLFAGIYSLRTLCTVLPPGRLPKPAYQLLVFLRVAPPK